MQLSLETSLCPAERGDGTASAIHLAAYQAPPGLRPRRLSIAIIGAVMVHPRRPSRHGERGQALEYSLILVLVAVGLMTVLAVLRATTQRVYSHSASAVKISASYSPSGGVRLTTPSSTAVIPASLGTPSDGTNDKESPDSLSGTTYSRTN